MKTTYTLIETNVTESQFDNTTDLLVYLHNKDDAPEMPRFAPIPEVKVTPILSIHNLLGDLQDPRFSLRKIDSLCAKYGTSAGAIEGLLEDNGISFVYRTKRGTGEELIGLAARN